MKDFILGTVFTLSVIFYLVITGHEEFHKSHLNGEGFIEFNDTNAMTELRDFLIESLAGDRTVIINVDITKIARGEKSTVTHCSEAMIENTLLIGGVFDIYCHRGPKLEKGES